jgi:hypothetical protein
MMWKFRCWPTFGVIKKVKLSANVVILNEFMDSLHITPIYIGPNNDMILLSTMMNTSICKLTIILWRNEAEHIYF